MGLLLLLVREVEVRGLLVDDRLVHLLSRALRLVLFLRWLLLRQAHELVLLRVVLLLLRVLIHNGHLVGVELVLVDEEGRVLVGVHVLRHSLLLYQLKLRLLSFSTIAITLH